MKLSTNPAVYYYIIFLFTYNHTNPYPAVINVPVADLIGNPITTLRPIDIPEKAYRDIPTCGAQINSSFACPRLHQLLYNEIIDVIKTTDEEAHINIPQTFYVTPSSSTPQTNYWILKKNITPLTDITAKNVSLEHIPPAITFSNRNQTNLDNTNIITLKEPLYCHHLNTTLSAGTRLVQAPSNKKKSSGPIEVFIINYKTMQEHRIKIARNKCRCFCTQTTDEKISNYVDILKKWAHTKKGCIPYVWGGISFIHTKTGSFKEITQNTNNSDYSYYHYDKDTTTPKSGFDCSGVVLRATQMCDIPYFCKNTTTIAHCLKPAAPEQQLIPGDLILVRGHVMVVSDTNKNLLIEARSYGHGYGKLHEIPINQVFEDILTYKDLVDACFKKKVIKRKDKEGKVRDSFSNVQLFSIKSVWDKNIPPHAS